MTPMERAIGFHCRNGAHRRLRNRNQPHMISVTRHLPTSHQIQSHIGLIARDVINAPTGFLPTNIRFHKLLSIPIMSCIVSPTFCPPPTHPLGAIPQKGFMSRMAINYFIKDCNEDEVPMNIYIYIYIYIYIIFHDL